MNFDKSISSLPNLRINMFLNPVQIGHVVTKPIADKCWLFCTVINDSMYARMGQTNGETVVTLRYHIPECCNRYLILQSSVGTFRVILVRYREDWPGSEWHHINSARSGPPWPWAQSFVGLDVIWLCVFISLVWLHLLRKLRCWQK